MTSEIEIDRLLRVVAEQTSRALSAERTTMSVLDHESGELWSRVDRPNLMIKVPATEEGVTAVKELIAGGININITLIFSLKQYRDTAAAYLEGLGRWINSSRMKRGRNSRMNNIRQRCCGEYGIPLSMLLDRLADPSRPSLFPVLPEKDLQLLRCLIS